MLKLYSIMEGRSCQKTAGRQVGVSNFDADQMERIQSIAPIATLQTPYSLLARQGEATTLPFAAEHRIGVISYSPMSSGLPSGAMTRERIANFPSDDFRRAAPEFSEPRLSHNLALVEGLREMGMGYHCTPGEIAIAWVLKNPAITGAIVGVRSATQVAGIISAANIELGLDDVKTLNAFLANMRPSLVEKLVHKTKRIVRRIAKM